MKITCEIAISFFSIYMMWLNALTLLSLFTSTLAFQPPANAARRAVFEPAVRASRRAPLMPRTPTLVLAADNSEDRPTLAGEKVGLALIAVAVGYGLGAAGVTPATLFALPGEIFKNPILQKAGKKAIGGGLSGAIAGVAQVLTLMWLRTTMNYQYRYGTGTGATIKALWKQGGIPRFYQGITYAIFQTPLSRFGDTAANTGVLELLALTTWGVDLPIALKTALSSGAGSLWRIGLTPLDTLKTTLQVEGPRPISHEPHPHPLSLTLSLTLTL